GGSDVIDITNLNFAIATPLAYSGTTTAGALTATDGTNTATINFTGNYTTANFKLADDTHGGSLITFVNH
ncbi:hypothetical protein, partial [Acidisphaera sp. L21]|uniref:hypothetical protein n=1 Tax=Acidisphaera sp. L21 TaxID=1641851 RepID=UPI001C2072A6